MNRVLRLFLCALIGSVLGMLWVDISAPALDVNSLKNVPGFSPKNNKHSAILRITDMDGIPVCTAVVISDELAITAAHCFIKPSLMFREYRTDPFKVSNSEGKFVNILAHAHQANYKIDIALLKGDFTAFQKAKINPDNNPFDNTMEDQHYGCGYGFGSKTMYCHSFKPTTYYEFVVGGVGRAVPGMSGGPVFNPLTGELVGIYKGVLDDMALIVPVQGIFAMFRLGI